MSTTAETKEMKVTVIDGKIIPQNVIVETIFGCNSSCVMCPINMPTERTKGLMSDDVFKKAIDGLAVYAENIVQIDLFGVGEPFLDKQMPERIKYTKSKGFKDVGVATNADLMTPKLAQVVLEAGLDTVMVSLDGTTPEVHEGIRVNTSYPRIIENVKTTIALRDKHNYSTKFVMRFIRQECNAHQWEEYRETWSKLISKDKGDLIIGYDLHSWGGEIDVQNRRELPPVPDDVPCHHLFDRLIILNDGSVVMCCSDMHLGEYVLGNVKDASPIDIFNNDKMNGFRKVHKGGKRKNMKICSGCTLLDSEAAKELE